MALPTEDAGGDRSSLLIAAYRSCETLPLIGGVFTRGRVEAQAVLSLLVAAVVDELDVTGFVRERLPQDAIDALVARIDVVALADQVIDGVDLRSIIRESTSMLTTGAIIDMPPAGLVGRLRNRRQGARDHL